jgi:hypothetical protein
MNGFGQVASVDEVSHHHLEVAEGGTSPVGAFDEEVAQDPHATPTTHPLLFKQQPRLSQVGEVPPQRLIESGLDSGMTPSSEIENCAPH